MAVQNDTEQKLYQWLKRKLPSCQLQRIETCTTAGVPDLYICSPSGVSVWVELKIVRGKHPIIRKEQYAWGMRHARISGKACVLGRKKDELKLWRFPMLEIESVGRNPKVVSEPLTVNQKEIRGELHLLHFLIYGEASL